MPVINPFDTSTVFLILDLLLSLITATRLSSFQLPMYAKAWILVKYHWPAKATLRSTHSIAHYLLDSLQMQYTINLHGPHTSSRNEARHLH